MKWRDVQVKAPKPGQQIYIWTKLSHRHKRRTVARWGEYELIGHNHKAHSCYDANNCVSYRGWRYWIPAKNMIPPEQTEAGSSAKNKEQE